MILSQVELNERLRALAAGRRMVYSLSVAILLVGSFVIALSGGVMVAIFWALVISGGPLAVPDDFIVLGFPVLVALMLTIGLIGLASREGVSAGETLRQSASRALWKGMIGGGIAGMIFGFLWALIVQGNAPLYALLLGSAVSPANGLFSAVSSIAEPLSLAWVSRESTRT